jgi:hypothetical protein
VQIAKSMQFSEEEDAIVWEFSSSGKYSVQSLYANVNNRGEGIDKYILLSSGS